MALLDILLGGACLVAWIIALASVRENTQLRKKTKAQYNQLQKAWALCRKLLDK